MRELALITAASARARLRWFKHHFYSWLVLSPLVLGISYMTAQRVTENLGSWKPGPAAALGLGVAFVLSLVGLSLTRAVAEIYHLRRPESYFDALPIDPTTHLHAAIVVRVGRTAVVGLLILAIRQIFVGRLETGLSVIGPLMVFVVLTAILEIFAAMAWIHWGHTRSFVTFTSSIAFVIAGVGVGASLLVPAVLAEGLVVSRWPLTAGLVLAAVTYSTVRVAHNRWRARDYEFARRVRPANRLRLVGLIRPGRRLSASSAAQLARDLQLTLRGFSSAVYVAVLLSLVWIAGVGLLLTSDALPRFVEDTWGLNASWTPGAMVVKLGCVLMTATVATVVAALAAHQLPHLWLERVTGTSGLDIWQAKLWHARLVSICAPVATWAAGMMAGAVPAFYGVPLLLECLLSWWLVSSIIGSLAYEMPSRPGLAVIVMATAGGAAGLISALAWPVGLLVYVFAMGALAERGRMRARYHLIEEAD